MRKQRVILKHGVNGPLRWRQREQRLALQQDLTRVRLFKSRQDAQKRCFPGTALAQDRQELATYYIEAKGIEHRLLAVRLGYRSNLQKRSSALA